MAWGSGGISVCAAAGYQWWSTITGDGEGGGIAAWEDHRGENGDIYVQRVISDGIVAWMTDGISICTASSDQVRPAIVSDGNGGAIVTWYDHRDSDWDIYAQRVYSNGVTAWAMDGISLSKAPGNQLWPESIDDGAGGAIMVWGDERHSEDRDIYAQRVYSDGVVAWTADGVSLCTAAGWQQSPVIVGDGAGGAIVAWTDHRSDEEGDIYAQRVYSDGTVAWATDGISIAVGPYYQEEPDIASDRAGGAIITWQDGFYIHAQRVTSEGITIWGTNGITLATPSYVGSGQERPRIAMDGAGGALVVWVDHRDSLIGYTGIDIYAQRVGEVGYRWYFPLAMRHDSWGTADGDIASQDQGGDRR